MAYRRRNGPVHRRPAWTERKSASAPPASRICAREKKVKATP